MQPIKKYSLLLFLLGGLSIGITPVLGMNVQNVHRADEALKRALFDLIGSPLEKREQIKNKIKEALAQGANPNFLPDQFGDDIIPLFYVATLFGFFYPEPNNQLIDILLNAGADINVKDKNGIPLILTVANAGLIEVVEHLLNRGAAIDADLKRKITSALQMLADKEKSQRVIKLMDTIVDQRMKPLVQEIRNNNIKAILSKINQMPNLVNLQDTKGNTLLHYAILEDKPEIVKILLAQGADPNIYNKERDTAIMLAAEKPHILALFGQMYQEEQKKEGKKQKEETEAVSSKSLFNAAVSKPLFNAITNNNLPDIRQALAEGAQINNLSPELNMTPLMFAVYKLHPRIVKYLLDQGAQVGIKNAQGKTAYDLASNAVQAFKDNPELHLKAQVITQLLAE